MESLQPHCTRLTPNGQGSARRGRGRGGKGRNNTWWSDIVDKTDMKNERFEKYYRAQGILADDEWECFMESMRGPLPTTFRVAGSRQFAVPPSLIEKSAHLVSEQRMC